MESARIKSEILTRIKNNASKCGLELGLDILSLLAEYSVFHVIYQILNYLDYLDVFSCSAVSKSWNFIIQDSLDHSKKLKRGWSSKNPRIKIIQCDKARSVCTINELSSDGESIFFGIGTPGNLELWNRRPYPTRKWIKKSVHPDGVYSLEMNTKYCFSGGGEDGIVYIWNRESGDLLHSLISHEYIVWKIQLLRDGNLFTASYDCSICVYTSTKKDDWVLKKTLKGPLGWADALECNGEIMITQDEKTFVLSVWNLCWNENEVSDNCCELLFSLVGHEEEVNCAIIHGNQYILSGSSDKTLRLWSYESGECLHVLTGFKGKVWCADMNNTQIIAGGRFGQIGFWSLEELNEGKGRILDPHSHITAVGSIKLEKLGLLSGDGEGHIFELDFWDT
ncbi:uncharacterized protein [Lepeophtheirus salmonis]|uniref:uncharacterized protein n=1 Tax=Lepeophtheirus salmonis TaxID=72036 RepID=UPI001AE4E956|nr:F-box/WD repeat-containing protein 11-like [Lepeophtheirus salmonis]